MAKPKSLEKSEIKKPSVMQGERYLPSAFDDSLSYLEKLNKVIKYLHEYSDVTNDMIERWNEVIEWVMDNGLEEAVSDQLQDWLEDGTLRDVIEDEVFGDFKDQLDKMADSLDELNKTLESEIEALLERLENMNKPISVTVGDDKDYETLKEAIEYFEKLAIKPRKATIKISDGCELEEQVIMENKDFRYLTVEADETIPVNLKKYDKLVRMYTAHGDRVLPAIYAYNTHLPTIDVKFKYKSTDHKEEYMAGCILEGSTGTFKEDNGFTDFPYIGLGLYHNSSAVAHENDFSGNGNRESMNDKSEKGDMRGFGLAVSHGSNFVGRDCRANRCGDVGFLCFRSSSMYIDGSEANEVGHHALAVHSGSHASASKCTFDYTIDDAVIIGDASICSLRGTSCSNSIQHHGLIVHRSARVDFNGGKANNNGANGIESQYSSTVRAENAEVKNNGKHGLMVRGNSFLQFTRGECRGNKSKGVNAWKGSNVDLDQAIIKENVVGIHSENAMVFTSKTTASENERDGIVIVHGGKVIGYRMSIVKNGRYGIKCEDGEFAGNKSRVLESGDTGVHASNGATMNLNKVSIRESGDRGIVASGAHILARDIEIKNSKRSAIVAKSGSFINVSRGTFSGNSSKELNVRSGSMIIGTESNGEPNTTPNKMSEKGFVIK